MIALLISASASWAQTPPANLEGKVIRIIVGYGPGGGYDVYARLIAPYLGKELKATVVVENQPGAGGLRAINELYVTPPDGLRIMLAKGSAALMAQLIGDPGVRYDLTKFTFLSGVGVSPEMWIAAPDSPIKTPADAIKADEVIRWSATGPMDGASDVSAMICEALKLHCKVIMGYPGTNEMALALRRNEADATVVNETSANAFTRQKNVRVITALSPERSRYFPDLPTIYEALPLSADAKWWFDTRFTAVKLGRIIIGPPGMSASVATQLQNALRRALADPALIAQGEKAQYLIEYQEPAVVHDAALRLLSGLTDAEKARVKKVVTTN